MKIMSAEYNEFTLALSRCIVELAEKFGIVENERLLLALELAAYDRRAEVGTAQVAGEMQCIQTELVLDEAHLQAVESDLENAGAADNP